MLIAITGLNGSGKDTVADYIKEKYGYKHISLSSLVNKLTIEQGKDIRKRDDLNFVADSQRKKDGSAFLAKQALKDYKNRVANIKGYSVIYRTDIGYKWDEDILHSKILYK